MSTTKFIGVNWGEKQFEGLNMTLVDFTPAFLNVNRGRTKAPTRQEVDWHWEDQVMKSYPDSDDRIRIFLLEQKSCPATHEFWEKRDDEKSWKEKRSWYEKQSMFYQSRRNLSEAERKTNKWAVIMTSAVTGDIIVPDIRLLPLRRISYFDIARKVLAANPKKKLQKHEIEDLWDGIMRTVYDFEAKLWNQKKNDLLSEMEYRKLQEEAKISRKRKRGEISDTPDDSDVEVPPATTKVKTEARVGKVAGPNQERQRAPRAPPTRRQHSGDSAPIQADIERLLEASQVATQVASPNTVLQSSAIQATLVAQPSAQPAIPAAQSSAQSAYRNPARAPVTGQSPVVQANPVPARGRGSRRRPGNGPRPSLVGQKTPVDPEATLIPIPNRGFNPPFATTGAGRRRSPLNQRRYQISATEMQQRRDRRWPSNNQ